MAPFGSGGAEVQRSDAQCPAGAIPISGGWVGEAGDPPISATVAASGWTQSGTWAVVMINDDDVDFASYHALAECASETGASAASVRALAGSHPFNAAAELAAVRAASRSTATKTRLLPRNASVRTHHRAPVRTTAARSTGEPGVFGGRVSSSTSGAVATGV
jgi:hypothetical protein